MSKDSKYTAEIFGSSWRQGPICEFDTITAARRWAEEYGTTADGCTIHDRQGRQIAAHRRDTSGDGTRWFRAAVAAAVLVLLPLSAQAQWGPTWSSVPPPNAYGSPYSGPNISNPYNPPPVGGIFNGWQPQPYQFPMSNSRPCVPAAGDRC